MFFHSRSGRATTLGPDPFPHAAPPPWPPRPPDPHRIQNRGRLIPVNACNVLSEKNVANLPTCENTSGGQRGDLRAERGTEGKAGRQDGPDDTASV